ncbi:D-lyxose/D-mannose family sugar isomerase [Thiospirochaeta perfilievii]|uniref:D-lyxose ketol-isomerase n=1 Tax=Thiospirochaeta perfilievii TaxID=252967 RepID=A0A5C1QG69_9SPIO|nr:D-lyxose/D-mannose family sugar isomerase [Thiospirochaeta perfilievii]QEN05536.1 D-lyxose/D-mannose family sugar isomerase [Thiospirochaeta perfilievii]
MKRSEINREILNSKKLFESIGFKLPVFASWSPEDWTGMGDEVDEIVENSLGWDVTDYGLGDYNKVGLFLFTIRNGNYKNRDKYPKGYAEKIMVIKENQLAPMHFHWNKREDIINRGGGILSLTLYKADKDENLGDEEFSVSIDGVRKNLKPGAVVLLNPGESICLEPYIYHSFTGVNGDVVVGEVSDVNDDENDNRFFEPIGRFPTIEEDEKPIHLLCNEYVKWKK